MFITKHLLALVALAVGAASSCDVHNLGTSVKIFDAAYGPDHPHAKFYKNVLNAM